MAGLRSVVEARGGFASKRDLVAIGATDRMLTAAVRTGVLTRVRNGWYTTRPDSDPAVRAVRVGGKLTGKAALAELGAWSWMPATRLEVAVPRNAARLRDADDRRRPRGPDAGVFVFWEDDEVCASGSEWAVDVVHALIRVVLTESFEDAVIALDWAWCSGRLDRLDFERIILALPRELQGIRDWVDPASQSILETTARVRLRRAGHRVRTQVPVREGLEWIDLVVDDVVALELDGREHHEHAFERDRRKDLRIAIDGRLPLRVGFTMVRDEWPSIERAVGMLARRSRIPALASVPFVGNSGTTQVMRARHCRGRPARSSPS